VDRFEAVILRGERPEPPSEAFGPCFKREARATAQFLLLPEKEAVVTINRGGKKVVVRYLPAKPGPKGEGFEWVRVKGVPDDRCREKQSSAFCTWPGDGCHKVRYGGRGPTCVGRRYDLERADAVPSIAHRIMQSTTLSPVHMNRFVTSIGASSVPWCVSAVRSPSSISAPSTVAAQAGARRASRPKTGAQTAM